MDLITYHTEAMRSAPERKSKRAEDCTDVGHALLGLMSEQGELADTLKRHAIYGTPLDQVNIDVELGDWAWYLVLLSRAFSVDYALDVDEKLFSIWDAHGHILVSVTANPSLWDEAPVLGYAAVTALLQIPTASLDDLRRGDSESLLQAWIGWLAAVRALSKRPYTEILQMNIDKLRLRFPDKFTQEAAVNRDVDAERRQAEGS